MFQKVNLSYKLEDAEAVTKGQHNRHAQVTRFLSVPCFSPNDFQQRSRKMKTAHLESDNPTEVIERTAACRTCRTTQLLRCITTSSAYRKPLGGPVLAVEIGKGRGAEDDSGR